MFGFLFSKRQYISLPWRLQSCVLVAREWAVYARAMQSFDSTSCALVRCEWTRCSSIKILKMNVNKHVMQHLCFIMFVSGGDGSHYMQMMSVCTSSNTWIGEEYDPLLMEKIKVMLERESLNCHDYLNKASSSQQFDTIDELWRQKTAEWMFKVRSRCYSLIAVLMRLSSTMLQALTFSHTNPNR